MGAPWMDQINDNFNYLYAREQFFVYLSTAQSIGNGAQTTVAYNTVAIDNVSGWNTSTHEYSAGPGLWLFNSSAAFAGNSTGARGIAIFTAPVVQISAAIDSIGRCTTTLLAYFSTTQNVGASVYQTSGAALNTSTGAYSVYFSGVRVG